MIQLRDRETGASIGDITEEQLQFLIDHLEEESEEDTDYYLNRATLNLLKEKDLDASLLKLLEEALGDREDLEIEWSRS
ncbi:MAG: galactosyldiacylglycerol synthase [Thermodesulfobacteriota bacterium]|nr:galactosyldiacylglycerol synthase [Thermodesulfobacteriota bacterium]